jgi:hypothetical protein
MSMKDLDYGKLPLADAIPLEAPENVYALGWVRILDKGGASWAVHRDDYQRVHDWWTQGTEPFLEAAGIFGGRITLRRGDVTGILLHTQDSLRTECAYDLWRMDQRTPGWKDPD